MLTWVKWMFWAINLLGVGDRQFSIEILGRSNLDSCSTAPNVVGSFFTIYAVSHVLALQQIFVYVMGENLSKPEWFSLNSCVCLYSVMCIKAMRFVYCASNSAHPASMHSTSKQESTSISPLIFKWCLHRALITSKLQIERNGKHFHCVVWLSIISAR